MIFQSVIGEIIVMRTGVSEPSVSFFVKDWMVDRRLVQEEKLIKSKWKVRLKLSPAYSSGNNAPIMKCQIELTRLDASLTGSTAVRSYKCNERTLSLNLKGLFVSGKLFEKGATSAQKNSSSPPSPRNSIYIQLISIHENVVLTNVMCAWIQLRVRVWLGEWVTGRWLGWMAGVESAGLWHQNPGSHPHCGQV